MSAALQENKIWGQQVYLADCYAYIVVILTSDLAAIRVSFSLGINEALHSSGFPSVYLLLMLCACLLSQNQCSLGRHLMYSMYAVCSTVYVQYDCILPTYDWHINLTYLCNFDMFFLNICTLHLWWFWVRSAGHLIHSHSYSVLLLFHGKLSSFPLYFLKNMCDDAFVPVDERTVDQRCFCTVCITTLHRVYYYYT